MSNIMFFITTLLLISALMLGCSTKEESEDAVETNVEMVKTADAEDTDAPEIWNEVCPVQGEAVNPEAPTVSFEGKVYGFCCEGCDKKFLEDPAKYVKNLSEDGETFIKS